MVLSEGGIIPAKGGTMTPEGGNQGLCHARKVEGTEDLLKSILSLLYLSYIYISINIGVMLKVKKN